jgi:hypothetical protein
MIDLTSSPEVVRKPQVKRRLKSDKTIIPSYILDSISESDSSNVPHKCKNKVFNAATGFGSTLLDSNATQLPLSQQYGRDVDKSAKVNVKRQTAQGKVPADSSGRKISDLNLSDSDESVFQKEAVNDKKKAKRKPSRKDEKYAELSEAGIIIESDFLSSDLGVSLKEIFDEKSMKVFDVSCPSARGLIRWYGRQADQM